MRVRSIGDVKNFGNFYHIFLHQELGGALDGELVLQVGADALHRLYATGFSKGLPILGSEQIGDNFYLLLKKS